MKIFFLILIGLCIVCGVYIFSLSKNNTSLSLTSPSFTMTTGYQDYDPNNLPTSGDIVLFFHARWCPSCLEAEKNFQESIFPENLTILKVDFDTAKDLRVKYGILSQTSYAYIQPNGDLIKRWIGGRDVADIVEQINEVKANTKVITNNNTNTSTNNSGQLTSDNGQRSVAYFAGGCFRCMEGPFEAIDGVSEVINGYAGGSKETANYDKVSMGTTKHREAVKVIYDPSKVSYGQLLKTYRTQIDPTDAGGQFADRGYQYTTAIFYENDLQKSQAEESKSKLQEAKKFQEPIAVQIVAFESFYPAEEYHQDYYKKNADHYGRYKKGSGRGGYIEENEKEVGELLEVAKVEQVAKIAKEEMAEKQNGTKKWKTLTIDQLSESQKNILFAGGTEPPFQNEYRDNHADGIYVDVLDGTPLFSSTDKFDSGTGRPSFTRPIKESMVSEHTDTKLRVPRTEIKSSSSSGHLGHVFDDGPASKGGQRYCINSAALRFVPLSQMKEEGYEEYLKLFTK